MESDDSEFDNYVPEYNNAQQDTTYLNSVVTADVHGSDEDGIYRGIPNIDAETPQTSIREYANEF